MMHDLARGSNLDKSPLILEDGANPNLAAANWAMRYVRGSCCSAVTMMAFAALCSSICRGQGIDAESRPETTCTETLQARHSDAAEALALDETGGRVIREDCTLTFRTPGGEHALTSNLSEDAEHLAYIYRGGLPHGFDLVEVRYYERREYLIIDRTGLQKQHLVGEPVLSPDRERVVATSLDLVAGIRPNALEIWRLEDRFARLEVSIRSNEWGPSDATWIDATTIAFTQNFGPFGDRRETARMRLTPSGWSFEPGVASGPFGGR